MTADKYLWSLRNPRPRMQPVPVTRSLAVLLISSNCGKGPPLDNGFCPCCEEIWKSNDLSLRVVVLRLPRVS